jgi:hypothetical protein
MITVKGSLSYFSAAKNSINQFKAVVWGLVPSDVLRLLIMELQEIFVCAHDTLGGYNPETF